MMIENIMFNKGQDFMSQPLSQGIDEIEKAGEIMVEASAIITKMRSELLKERSSLHTTTKQIDQNVEDLREMLKSRAAVGMKKYGVSTMRFDLSLGDWLNHALEETLDNAVYLRAAMRKLDSTQNDKSL